MCVMRKHKHTLTVGWKHSLFLRFFLIDLILMGVFVKTLNLADLSHFPAHLLLLLF